MTEIKNALIELIAEFVRIPSITGSEQELAKYIIDKLTESGLDSKLVANNNVISEYTVANKIAPTVILNGHLDTVRPVRGWTFDPFQPTIVDDNKLYGLGVADMKAGLAIILQTFIELVKNYKLKYNLIFTAVAGEEGVSDGAYKLLTEHKLNGDLCLISEPSNEQVMLGCRGRYALVIEVFGKSAHGARPYEGVNAIDACCKIVSALNKLPLRNHPKLGLGSYCVLKIEGGSEFLSVPEYCKLVVDRHVVCGETQELIYSDFNNLLKTIDLKGCEIKLEFTPRPTPFLEPYLTSPETQSVAQFLNTYRDYYKREPEIIYGRAVGDYNLFGVRMPTIVYGPTGAKFHQADEFVDLPSVLRCYRFYLEFLKNLVL